VRQSLLADLADLADFFYQHLYLKKRHAELADLADSFYQPCTKKPAKTS